MRWKLFRRRLSISAPRVAIRSHMPWPLRWVVLALAFGFSASLALWAFEFGKEIAGLGTEVVLDRDREDGIPLELGQPEGRGDRRHHRVEQVRQHGVGGRRLVGVHDQGAVRLRDALEEGRVPGDVGEEEGAPLAGPHGDGDDHGGIVTWRVTVRSPPGRGTVEPARPDVAPGWRSR